MPYENIDKSQTFKINSYIVFDMSKVTILTADLRRGSNSLNSDSGLSKKGRDLRDSTLSKFSLFLNSNFITVITRKLWTVNYLKVTVNL